MLKLSPSARALIVAEAEKGYPHEVCGILLGRGAEVSEAHPAKNSNTDRSRDRYLIDSLDQLSIEKDARARGLDVLGYYHSHPDHPARPSVTDAEQSWENVTYVIVGVEAGSVRAVTAWRRASGQKDLVEQAL